MEQVNVYSLAKRFKQLLSAEVVDALGRTVRFYQNGHATVHDRFEASLLPQPLQGEWRRTHTLFRRGQRGYDILPGSKEEWLRKIAQAFGEAIRVYRALSSVFCGQETEGHLRGLT